MAVQVFVGGEFETQTVHNMTRLVDEGYRCGMPVLGVTAVGKELVRDARYLGLATRIFAELGAQVVKTYYCDEGFEKVTAGCPVPIVMAGGKKLPELDALTMAYRAVEAGAAGVDMGRNIFQSDAPAGDDPGRPQGRPRRRCARRDAYEVYQALAPSEIRGDGRRRSRAPPSDQDADERPALRAPAPGRPAPERRAC